MGKLTQPLSKIRDYIIEFFDETDEDGIKRLYLAFGPQGYSFSIVKLEKRLLIVGTKHTETVRL